jgi:hypothetical protein
MIKDVCFNDPLVAVLSSCGFKVRRLFSLGFRARATPALKTVCTVARQIDGSVLYHSLPELASSEGFGFPATRAKWALCAREDNFRFVPYALRAAQLHENRSQLKRIFNDWERFSTLPVIRPQIVWLTHNTLRKFAERGSGDFDFAGDGWVHWATDHA